MTSSPEDGSSDSRDIKQISANHSFSAPLHVMDTSPFPLIREPESADANATAPATSTASPTNAGVTLSSSLCYEYMPQLPSPQRTNNKGKGVQRSLDWHWHLASDASESEREGKPLLPSVRDIGVVLIFTCIHRTCIPIAIISTSFAAGHGPTANRASSPVRSCWSEFCASLFVQIHILRSYSSCSPCHRNYLCKYSRYSLPLHS